ncbi:hypothetical protein [Rhodococcoides corynebacterioides]|uniref:Uncharacterized protein n=1 Tax=Rhodococcoides corynebacterioides TaxID=53972 RepID=A0ABS7P511_9NOCA|nr:hypothetical protein [Rhodococcus corynebacterioides]MBY6366937.1 hypothetical protein [Rhodococcus corynebacterioides]MBY6407739.1 hypothetical protein [Rhodococcus corynebacterioides]
MQTLCEADVETYVATWIAAATSRARDLGLPDDVPVLLSTDATESYDDGDLEPLYDYAFATVALPGCGYTPTTYPHRDASGMPDVEAFVDAERTASRSYRDRAASARNKHSRRESGVERAAGEPPSIQKRRPRNPF